MQLRSNQAERKRKKSLHPLLVSNQLKVMYSYLIHVTKENKKRSYYSDTYQDRKTPTTGSSLLRTLQFFPDSVPPCVLF